MWIQLPRHQLLIVPQVPVNFCTVALLIFKYRALHWITGSQCRRNRMIQNGQQLCPELFKPIFQAAQTKPKHRAEITHFPINLSPSNEYLYVRLGLTASISIAKKTGGCGRDWRIRDSGYISLSDYATRMLQQILGWISKHQDPGWALAGHVIGNAGPWLPNSEPQITGRVSWEKAPIFWTVTAGSGLGGLSVWSCTRAFMPVMFLHVCLP